MPETEMTEEEEIVATDSGDAQINDTDIVFDCPHCGHNLCIDYRGAGLQITCSECGEAVLVPIPDGMKIDDLDLDPGEILHCDVFGLKFHPFLLGGIGLVVCVAVAYVASFVLREKGRDLTGLTLKTLKVRP